MERRALIALMAITAMIGAGVVAGSAYAFLRNNHDMGEWRAKIEDASRIEEAVLIDQGSRFGLQPGTNGDHCDREAWLVYRTDLATQAIERELTKALEGFVGEWWVTQIEPGIVRVDFWYRFDDPGLDYRCM